MWNLKWIVFCFIIWASGYSSFGQESSTFDNKSFGEVEKIIRETVVSDFEAATAAANYYIKKAQLENDILNEGIGIYSLGFCYLQNRKISKAHTEFETLLAFAKAHNNKELIVRAYVLGANVKLLVPEANQSLKYLNLALPISEEMEDKVWRELILSHISMLLQLTGDFEAAIDIRKKCINHFENKLIDSVYTEKIKNKTIISNYYLITDSYIKLEDGDSAKYYLNHIKQISDALADSCYKRFYYLGQAEVDFFEKNFLSAKINFNKSLEFCPPDYGLFDLRMAYRFGKVEHGLKNYEATKNILIQGLVDYEVEASEEGFMDDYYKLIADACKETGDYEQANLYFEKYINSKAEFNKIKGDISLAVRQKEIDDFQLELSELKIDKAIQKNYLLYLFLGASISILILLFFLLRFYKIRKRNEVKFQDLLNQLNEKDLTNIEVLSSDEKILVEKSNGDISTEITKLILDGLNRLEEKKYFLSQDCNSYNVAKKIKTNTSYLSKVINIHFEKNFNSYINELRINYAIINLKDDPKFRSFSIQSIAEDLGYKSADSFAKYFKIQTGLNPSFYIKQLNNL